MADRKADSRRTLGMGLEPGIGLVTFVPHPCAIQQDLEAWGQPPAAWPLLVEQPGRTKAAAPRRWPGDSVLRWVEGEDSERRVTQEARRGVVGHARQLAQQHAQSYAAAQGKAAAAIADHVQHVHARWLAWEADATAALAE